MEKSLRQGAIATPYSLFAAIARLALLVFLLHPIGAVVENILLGTATSPSPLSCFDAADTLHRPATARCDQSVQCSPSVRSACVHIESAATRKLCTRRRRPSFLLMAGVTISAANSMAAAAHLARAPTRSCRRSARACRQQSAGTHPLVSNTAAGRRPRP